MICVCANAGVISAGPWNSKRCCAQGVQGCMQRVLSNSALQGCGPGGGVHVEQQEVPDRGRLGAETGDRPGLTETPSF